MKISPEQLKLYAVTDRSWLKPDETLASVTEELLRAGVSCVQLREKNASDEEILQEAALLKEICERYNVPLIINDRPDLAQKANASGVHVGLSDMGIQKARQLLGPDFIIGGSAHNVEEALAAQNAGADYIGCGAVFGSTTKTNVTQLPVETLRAICQAVEIPVVAIGGVTADNLYLLAGIQADIKTMIMNGVYAMSAITALTAQNTTGVYGIQETSPEFLDNQLDCIFTDIFPDAVKIGMLSSAEIMHHVAVKLQQYHAHHIVLDPVMISTSGHRLMDKDAEQTLQKELFPLAEIITPNIPEAEALTGLQITNADSMEEAAHKLYESFHISVLLKGGHRINDANDLLYTNGHGIWLHGERINNPNTHGTGCTLSSAIASNLARGFSLEDSVRRSKQYLTDALKAQLDLGHGSGPLDHTLGKTQ